MNVRFANRDLEACASEVSRAVRRWGPQVGRRYVQRLAVIDAAPTFNSLYAIRSFRLHKLTGPRTETYAIDLQGRWRLIISLTNAGDVMVEEVTNHYGD